VYSSIITVYKQYKRINENKLARRAMIRYERDRGHVYISSKNRRQERLGRIRSESDLLVQL